MATETVILIPTHSPDESLRQLLQDLRERTTRPIVVVDDGNIQPSQQSFLLTLTHMGFIHLVHHAFYKGRGATLKTGFTYVRQHFPETVGVVTVDTDAQTKATDIITMAERLESQPDHLVLGFHPSSQGGLVGKLTALLFELVTAQAWPDAQTAIQTIPSAILPSLLDIQGETWDYELNVLVDLARRQLPVDFERLDGASQTVGHARVMANLFKHLISSLAPVLLDLALFSLLAYLFGFGFLGLTLAALLARLLSGVVNHIFNARWLLGLEPSLEKVKRYVMVFCLTMVISVLSVALLSQWTGHHVMLKVAIDGLLFLAGYRAQQNFVLSQDRYDETSESEELSARHA